MNFLLIISKADIAATTFNEQLFQNYDLKNISENYYLLKTNGINKIYVWITQKQHLYLNEKEDLDSQIPNYKQINQIIFLSKHSTLTNNKPPSMLIHSIGNWGKAELGGKDHTLVKTDPILIRTLLLELKKNKYPQIKKYEIKQEATHHGPYLNKNTIFFEIGSQEIDWKNKNAVKYMLTILISNIINYNRQKIKTQKNWVEAVGVGGSHYCTKFNRITFDEKKQFCFGHVVANYAIQEIEKNPKLLNQAKEKSGAKIIIREEEIK
ncbi:MAG TPA: D-aminoacyl-tRNA deacylase [Candidatus Diapherotrites archaeon]|nr:D-aminoacyl-tRNA deacylase [Candidatus Diapherotrites archaeon]